MKKLLVVVAFLGFLAVPTATTGRSPRVTPTSSGRVTVPAGQTVKALVSCPGRRLVTGGGYGILEEDGQFRVLYSHPAPASSRSRSWVVGVSNDGVADITLTVFAMCIRR